MSDPSASASRSSAARSGDTAANTSPPAGGAPDADLVRLRDENSRLAQANAVLTHDNAHLRGDNVELRHANLDLTHVVDGTDRPTLILDRELRVVRVNPSLCTAFQLTAPAPGTPVKVVTEQLADEPAVVQELARVVRSGTWGQRQVRAASGRWYLLRAFPFGDSVEPAGVIVTFADINGAKTIETRFQLAMSAARLVWWDWDFATEVIAVYGEARCILGYTIETLPRTYEAWLEHTHPDDVAAVRAALRACVEGGADWSLIHRFRAADGAWRWVQNCGRAAEVDERGVPTRMLGITRDIHEAHEAALAVRRDAAILAQLQDAVITTDADYRIVSVNDAYETIFGWKKEEALDRHALYRVPEFARPEAKRVFDRVLRGESVAFDWEDYRRDGSRVWIRWRARPFLDDRGRLIGTVNVGSDISPQMAAAERQRELQQQLFHAQKMDTLGTLAGGIAHDLNNILAAIFGYSELAAMRASDNPEVRHFNEQIVKAGVRGRELVKRILSFSRFEEPERRPVRLAEVIGDAAKFIRATLPATVEMVAEPVPDDLPPVLADPHQLCQVLLNLATNAAHAMDHRGQFILRVRSENLGEPRAVATGELAAGRYFVVEAADTGHGIPPAVLPRIFEPFFTTKQEGEGTGLGLSVVRAIIEGHGGRIDVRSEPGQGACFLIYLPQAAAPPVTPAVSAPTRQIPRGDNQTIAIIDDEAQIASAMAAGLQRLGYQVTTFDSALKFWALFRIAPNGIDAIVTDQTMPGMTGLELVRRLREEGHEIPVLVITGFSVQIRPETVQQFTHLSVLRKPFEYHELGTSVHALFAKP